MEKAEKIEPHGAYFCNGNDTTAVEPTRELIAKVKPEYLKILKAVDGHASLLSNRRLREVVGWEHVTSWRDAGRAPVRGSTG
jgi:hypothetical protein